MDELIRDIETNCTDLKTHWSKEYFDKFTSAARSEPDQSVMILKLLKVVIVKINESLKDDSFLIEESNKELNIYIQIFDTILDTFKINDIDSEGLEEYSELFSQVSSLNELKFLKLSFISSLLYKFSTIGVLSNNQMSRIFDSIKINIDELTGFGKTDITRKYRLSLIRLFDSLVRDNYDKFLLEIQNIYE